MTDEEYEVVLDNTVKEIGAQQKWCDDQKAAFERVLQTRRDLVECRQQLAEARALIRAYSQAQNMGGLYAAEQDHAAALKAAREQS